MGGDVGSPEEARRSGRGSARRSAQELSNGTGTGASWPKGLVAEGQSPPLPAVKTLAQFDARVYHGTLAGPFSQLDAFCERSCPLSFGSSAVSI